MKIVKEQNDNLSAKLKINIEEADYKDLVKKELNKIRAQAQMPGFRKGHTPIGMIQKLYGMSVMVDEINKLLQEQVGQFLEDEKMDILGAPFPAEESPVLDFHNNKDFDFILDVVLTPEVNIDFLKTMPTTYYKIKPTKEQIDEQVTALRQQFGEMLEEKGAIQEKDYLRCDYQSVDDPEISSTSFFFVDAERHPGSQKFIGHQFGETIEIDVEKECGDDPEKASNLLNLPTEENYKAKGVFKFTINEVKRRQEAPLDEGFYKKAFPNKEIDTEEEFRNAIGEVHSQISEETVDIWFFNTLFDKIIENANIVYADDVLRRYVNYQKKTEHDKEHEHKEGEECSTCGETTDEEFEKTKRGTSWELIQHHIIKEYGINVDKADLRQVAKERICRYFGADPQLDDEQLGYIAGIVDNIMQDEKQLRELFNNALDKKITQVLKEKTDVTEKEVTWDEFRKIAESKKEGENADEADKADKETVEEASKKKAKATEDGEEKPKAKRKSKKDENQQSLFED